MNATRKPSDSTRTPSVASNASNIKHVDSNSKTREGGGGGGGEGEEESEKASPPDRLSPETPGRNDQKSAS